VCVGQEKERQQVSQATHVLLSQEPETNRAINGMNTRVRADPNIDSGRVKPASQSANENANVCSFLCTEKAKGIVTVHGP
jgi:hypothetical protein